MTRPERVQSLYCRLVWFRPNFCDDLLCKGADSKEVSKSGDCGSLEHLFLSFSHSVSQGWICSGKFTCCHTETEVADQTFHLTKSVYRHGLTSPSADPRTSGAWQGSHWSANFEVTCMAWPGKIPPQAGFEPGSFALEADNLTTRPSRQQPGTNHSLGLAVRWLTLQGEAQGSIIPFLVWFIPLTLYRYSSGYPDWCLVFGVCAGTGLPSISMLW